MTARSLQLAAVALALAGGATAAASATGTPAGDDVKALWHAYAQCLREHGSPSLADPRVLPNGNADWGGQIQELRRALGRVEEEGADRGRGKGGPCDDELRALPASALNPGPTAAQMRQLVLLSRCVRRHGVRDWPDPNPDGGFPFNQRLRSLGKLGIAELTDPCQQHLGAFPVAPAETNGKRA